eukprot:gene24759-biopygen20915
MPHRAVPGGTGHWRGHGAGVAPGYRLQFGISGAGVVRAWRGHVLFPQVRNRKRSQRENGRGDAGSVASRTAGPRRNGNPYDSNLKKRVRPGRTSSAVSPCARAGVAEPECSTFGPPSSAASRRRRGCGSARRGWESSTQSAAVTCDWRCSAFVPPYPPVGGHKLARGQSRFWRLSLSRRLSTITIRVPSKIVPPGCSLEVGVVRWTGPAGPAAPSSSCRKIRGGYLMCSNSVSFRFGRGDNAWCVQLCDGQVPAGRSRVWGAHGKYSKESDKKTQFSPVSP